MTNDKKLCDCEIPSMGNLIGVGNDGCCTKCNRQIYSPEPNAHVLNTYDSIVGENVDLKAALNGGEEVAYCPVCGSCGTDCCPADMCHTVKKVKMEGLHCHENAASYLEMMKDYDSIVEQRDRAVELLRYYEGLFELSLSVDPEERATTMDADDLIDYASGNIEWKQDEARKLQTFLKELKDKEK